MLNRASTINNTSELPFVRLNFNTKNIVSSSYFYLQINDITFVQPDKCKSVSADAIKTGFSRLVLRCFQC